MLLLALAALIFGGCSSPESVSHLQGRGTKQVYDAAYEHVWSAAVAAAQQGDLMILKADKEHGYICSKRGLEVDSFGENVAIWIRVVAPKHIEVEVVSRSVGPPVILRNWEQRVINSISANLTTVS